MPTRMFNRALVYIGIFGLVFQLTAMLYVWWHQLSVQGFWLVLLAPLLCIASGLIPALQLQQEPDKR